jgi:flagellar biosynthesis GTPase FlhF
MSGVFIQPSEFLIFAAAGAVSAALYALFWLLRHLFKSGGLFETLADFTFAALSTAAFLFCLTELTDGSLRFFYFIAYLLTFSALLFLLNTFKTAIIAFFKSAAARFKKSALFVNISAFIKRQKVKAAEREEIKNKRYEKLKKQRLEKIEKKKRENEINKENNEKRKQEKKAELKKIRQEKIKKNNRQKEINKEKKSPHPNPSHGGEFWEKR